ncbi:MAG: thioredoxin family protein [Nitrososphaerota archaeon]|nr:thioredoxin family protein [Nitrososphaerota archaeon]MDG7010791.1 thioredoxin family protein [Nitrososphaerota archaeon]
MTAQVALVVAEWCPVRPSAKELWRNLRKEVDFHYDEIDIASPLGEKLVAESNILSVPTATIDGSVAFVGVPERNEAIRRVTKG